MNHRLPLTHLGLLVFLASASPGISQDFSEEDLAATIALDSGYPEEGYLGYARSLARTLSLLNPAPVEKVFKGRGPPPEIGSASGETRPPSPAGNLRQH